VWVHDNTITLRTGETTGAVEDSGDPAIFASGHNRFEANTYRLDSRAGRHFSWDDEELGWRAWRRRGLDLTGHVELLGP
jgi:hypothetical protein